METFHQFLNKKDREARKHLEIINKLLESNDFKVKNHLKDDEPYIFVYNPIKHASFDGIRIYKIGSQLAYRIQKEENTHPFGRAYQINVEDMFNDILSDHSKPDEAGKEVAKSIVNEVKKFFEKSADMEKDLRIGDFDKVTEPFNKVIVRSGDYGLDYSTLVYNKS